MGNSTTKVQDHNHYDNERSRNNKRVKTNSFSSVLANDDMMGPTFRRKKATTFSVGDKAFFTVPEDQSLSRVDLVELGTSTKFRQPSLTQKLVRRKQVSRDMFSADEIIFFTESSVSTGLKDNIDDIQKQENDSLFFPLRFTPRASVKPDVVGDGEKNVQDMWIDDGSKQAAVHDNTILRATRKDFIKTGILFCIMVAFVGVCIGWETHVDETHSIFGPVGNACVTPCYGDVDDNNFFIAHNDHFINGDVISLVIHIDPNPSEETQSDNEINVDIIRLNQGSNEEEIQTIVHTVKFGPPDEYKRVSQNSKITVDWDSPSNHHIINITSKNEKSLSLTLAAMRQTSLGQYSVLVAALIMIVVYIFILLEWIHRTLVSIFGSMVALFFLFLVNGGETDSIRTIMLHQEWSTLGLLFGMMILVGELSHTGIFEFFSVRLLVISSGSFRRLLVLLCLLTAVASAFLDNVTTMLLLAPLTIDMCHILDIDPRPYLISEVILSNIGGAATLIGDPPNIIIGSSFDEVGFVDFIINIMPCIFGIAVPLSLVTMVWVYNPYLTRQNMVELDIEKLKATYPIYDQPRLYIAGTATFFVILLFFLHPIHHIDTAWIALIGAFITIAFTNPHDVQDVLRNHVEWDTLLFFAGLFVLVEVCATMGLLDAIGGVLANVISRQKEDQQQAIGITLILWVSAVTSAFLDNIPYTATMIPVIRILHEKLPDTLPLKTLVWALSFGACLGGNGTLLGASANIVTAGIASRKGYAISFMNFFYPGMLVMIITTAIANLYMLIVYVWI